MTDQISDEKSPGLWRRIWCCLRGPAPEEVALREAVEEMIAPSDGDGTGQRKVRETEREILTNIIALHDKDVGDCMVPRAQIVSIDVDAPHEDLLALMNEHAHSRIPAYHDTLDEMIGFIHMKDVLVRLSKKEEFKLRDLLRPVFFVAPSMPVSKLILQMRQKRQHMAMVIDEFGGIDGLITIEDLIEEIVGDIEDEHDLPPEPFVITRNDGSLLIDASMPIEDFENRIGFDVLAQDERESIETLSGFVFHLAGHIPEIGAIVDGPRDMKFDVLDSDSTRIKRVRVSGVK